MCIRDRSTGRTADSMEGERLHRLMKRLLAIVEVGGNPDEHARQLARGIAPSFTVSEVAISAVKRKLFDRSANPPETMAKYDELHTSPNFAPGDLDRFVTLLSKILDDKALVVMLSQSLSAKSVGGARARLTPSRQTPVSGRRRPETPSADKPSLVERTSLRSTPAPVPANITAASTLSPMSKHMIENVTLGTPKEESGAITPAAAPREDDLKKESRVPEWVKARPFLSGCQYLSALSSTQPSESPYSVKRDKPTELSEYPVDVQELLVIEDLLHVMMGLDGRFFKFKMEPDPAEEGATKLGITVDAALDPSLADLANRISPLGVCYVNVMRFVDANSVFKCGMVNHAFSAAVRWLTREYLTLLAQLETQHRGGNLTLQRLWFYIQPSAQVMRILEQLTTEASQTYALSLIHISEPTRPY
eukprot:TRINITY_DN27778_c0_g1_i1.p1 TRINITY_DN27778_c0_g1~~TRINITY_DN27778_c0_g1_i1.p1  ORF type:complete len:420 (-),score=111.14 TRINITY_DN27778_c0_g1_i1:67-1326(-)